MSGVLMAAGIVVPLLLVCGAVRVRLRSTGRLSADSEEARLAQQAREAERRLGDIGRSAQEAIAAEALRRFRSQFGERW